MNRKAPITLLASLLIAGAAFAEHEGPAVSIKCDANKDGKVTKEEHRAAADKSFDAADADHDGTVTQGEITACAAKMKADHKGDKADSGQPDPTSSQSPESKPASGDTKPGGPTRTEGGEQPGSTNPSTKNNAPK